MMDYSAARKRAIWLLSRCNYHSQTLQRKLLEKGCSEEVACAVLADCRRMGILHDEDAILREFRRGWGPKVIEYKLRIEGREVRKAISREMQKTRILELMPKWASREKAYRALIRKGFDPELIIEIFSCRD